MKDKNIDELLNQTKKNSIGIDKKDKFIKTIKNIKRSVLISLLAVLFALSLCSCSYHNISITPDGDLNITPTEEYSNYTDGYEAVGSITWDVNNLLDKYNIEYYDSVNGYIKNDIEVYKQIKELKEDDLIGYYHVLGEEESEKIVQILGYKNWDDFLTKKGCLDENGNPSISVWEYQTYVQLGEQINQEKGNEK